MRRHRTDYAQCYVKSISYQKFAYDSFLLSLVEWSYFNTHICKFESSQKDGSRAQLADSSKSYRKPRVFNGPILVTHCKLIALYVSISSYSEKYLSSIKWQSQLFTICVALTKYSQSKFSVQEVKHVSCRNFGKKRSRDFPFFKMFTIWNFLTDSGLIHASDVSRMRSCISILKILKLNPTKFSLK